MRRTSTRTPLSVFGYDPTADDILLVKEALKRARTLMIYRVNSGGKKATATVGGVTVTAACGGTRGNAISVAILTNADNATNVDVVTYLDGMVMDSQTVAKATGSANLKANDFVTFGSASSPDPGRGDPADRRHERNRQRRGPHRRTERLRSGILQRGRLPWDR